MLFSLAFHKVVGHRELLKMFSPTAMPTFPLVVILKPSDIPNLQSIASNIAEIIKNNPQTIGNTWQKTHLTFYFWCDFMMV